MGDIKLFRVADASVVELVGSASALEKHLQSVIEKNLEALLGVRFLASEVSTGPAHGGRIDSLGIDEDGSPVINQGLFYLDWLVDHRGEFELLVLRSTGQAAADAIDWSTPRLICIASDFTKYDEHAVQQIGRNINLIRYRHFAPDLLMLDLVNAAASKSVNGVNGPTPSAVAYKTVEELLATADREVQSWFETIKAFMLTLGDDVQFKPTKVYFAFRRIKNFASVEISPQARKVTVYVKLRVEDVQFQPGFTRDVTNVGHFGTGNVQIVIDSHADLLAAQPLIQRSYEQN
jgi:predicted transport protein